MHERDAKPIPPTPHAPNWRYTCPHCGKAWEMAERCEDFRQVCRDCIRIVLTPCIEGTYTCWRGHSAYFMCEDCQPAPTPEAMKCQSCGVWYKPPAPDDWGLHLVELCDSCFTKRRGRRYSR